MSGFFLSRWLLPCLSLRPSCPALFLPQPNTAPDKERAKLWSPPAVICAKGIPARDLRGWGNSLLGSPFPRPSWPLVFWPHVNSWPSERGNDGEATWLTAHLRRLLQTGKYTTFTTSLVIANQCSYYPAEKMQIKSAGNQNATRFVSQDEFETHATWMWSSATQ